jgi:hypothetical protein
MVNVYPYLMCFFISSFLFWFGQKIKQGQSEFFRWFIYAIALLIPTMLAGVRDISVGTDIILYGYPIFQDARISPSADAMPSIWDGWISKSFFMLNFYASQISDDYNVFLFLLMLIEISFVFFALYSWRDKIPLWISMFSFYIFFFNEFLCFLRQGLGMSIAFFGINYMFKRKFLKFLFWILIGMLFHNSVLLILAFYPLYWYSVKFNSSKAAMLLLASITAIILASSIIASLIFPSLADIISFANRTNQYLADGETGRIPYKIFLYFLFFALLFAYKKEAIFQKFPDTGNFFMIMAFLTAISQLIMFVGGEYASRFTLFAIWWMLYLVPVVFCSYGSTLVGRMAFSAAAVCYLLFYWYSTFIYFIHGGTQNYESAILRSIF